ncbi:ABC transporter ATP-binding protein [Haploplasma axanthum]|uniref:ABC-type multidrug/protein/lipid transport system ATPase component n=1 Tax=Haploplasma axanthum TaxID=29552 RepID=A0A449BC02_HAPAX|nr:ABC transporter ATP-binding protein [Haploplasma axanthum]VEU79966.1 ABC-type multidrug/protein/lipid transport system ATPase component [Haploplasma axanthum]
MLKTLSKFVKITFKAYPKYYLVIMFNALVNLFTMLTNIYGIKFILESLEYKNYEQTLVIAGILVLINVLKNLLDRLLIRINKVSRMKMTLRLDHLMAYKLMNTKYENLESTYYLDLKQRAKFANDNQGALFQLLEVFTVLISGLTNITSLFIIVITFDKIFIAVILVGAIINVLIVLASLKSQLKFYNEIIPINRKFGYYIGELLSYKNAKEYRFSKMNKLLEKRESEFINETDKYFVKFNLKSNLYMWALDVINYLQSGLTYGYIAYKSIINSLSIGTFSLYTTTVMNLTKEISKLINSILSLKRLSSYIEPFLELLELEDEENEGVLNVKRFETIEFKNVSFKYPGTEKFILKNLNFKIEKGEKISVVGLNGAGKTTLIKLVTRLYSPTQGEILLNGVNINMYDRKKYISFISAVFQDYQLFSYSFLENITGDLVDNEGALRSLEEINFTAHKDMPKGLLSEYSKAYHKDGIELSGGQEQKIAIARALYKKSDLTILDEPTSALDPLAEAAIYEEFNKLVKNKTAIYISHRMSSSVFCDKVLIINDGELEDFKSHKELMKNKEGLYYKMFTTQAENYQTNDII